MANAVTDDTFESSVLKSPLPVLVDFWAPWCAPCRAIAPVIDELSAEYEGQVSIVKMDVEENPKIPGKFGIRAIPTLILFQKGQIVEQVTGAVSKSNLKELLRKRLSADEAV